MNPSEPETIVQEKEEVPLTFSISKWDAELKRAANARVNFEQQWFTNLAFYRGKQWVIWRDNPLASSGVSLVNPKSKRKRLVFNRIMPICRREFTKLSKEDPEYFVRPNTTDQGDVAAAKTGEALAEYLVDMGKFPSRRRTAVWWAVKTGTGFLKTVYDPMSSLPVGSNGTDLNGMVGYSSPSPFHIYVPNLEIEDIDDQPWVCQQSAYTKEAVYKHFGVDVSEDVDVSTDASEVRFRSAINIRQNNNAKQVLVKEIWIKPCAEYPEGLLCVWVTGKILILRKWPYKFKTFPFRKIIHIPSGGFYGISVIEGLIPIQKEFNLTKSQLSEARDKTSKPALTVVKGSVDVQKIKSEPGQIIEVMPGAEPPRRLVNPDLPNYVTAMLSDYKSDFDDHSAQFEITKGQTPPGIEAASAIAYLQEENDTMLYHTVSSIEEAVAESGKQSLSLVQQYWDKTRIINTISKTNVQGVIEFKGKDLKNNIDLKVVSGSMAPRSIAAKQAQMMELVKMGAIPPEVSLKYFQMSDTNAMYDELHIDENQVIRENLRMARGEEVIVNEWDAHILHVQGHERFMKTQEYELLPQETQQLFIEHRQEHQTVHLAESLTNAPRTDEQSGGTSQSIPELPGGISGGIAGDTGSI